MSRSLHRFHGGLHLPGFKELTNGQETVFAGLPERLILPLQQHIGEPADPMVMVGQRVLKGQMLAKASGYVSVALHAPTSGRVAAIEPHPVPHPSGLDSICVILEADGADEWGERMPVTDYADMDPSHLRNLIRDAGIVGMGGAGFPTFIKLNPGPERRIDAVIINGVECEPYITCDDRLMRERSREIIAGACIVRHAVGARRCIIGVEDNKPEAYQAMVAAAGDDVEVKQVPTRYPAGGERQLTHVLTGKEIPSDGLPMEVGIVMQNVATVAAIYRTIALGEPLISRYVTVTGEALESPRNLEVLIGTPVEYLLEARGLREDALETLIMGGPMMGFALGDPRVPVVKTSNCILAGASHEPAPVSMPCIRCGACADACPVSLLPQQLYWHARAKDFDKVQDYHLFDCIECGCCSYVCPSAIPLVGFYRYAKTEIWSQERERDKADLARRRHEAHQQRLEREKQEREARHRKKQAALAARSGESEEDPKKAAIQAALERARAKKAARAEPPGVEE